MVGLELFPPPPLPRFTHGRAPGSKKCQIQSLTSILEAVPQDHCSPLADLGRLSTLVPGVPGQGDRLRAMAGWSDLEGWVAICFAGPPPHLC